MTGPIDSVATLRVDRWLTGGDADTVEIHYTPGFEALIGTPQLEVTGLDAQRWECQL